MASAKRGCLSVAAVLVLLAAIVAGVGAWFYYQQTRFADQPLTPSEDRASASDAFRSFTVSW